MDKTNIFKVLKESTLMVVPTLDAQLITPESSLRELGANSIDRAEIIMNTMEVLKIRVPMMSFANAKNMDELCSILLSQMEG